MIPKVFWLDNLFYSFTSRKTQLLNVNKGLIHQQSKLLYKELQGMSRSALIEWYQLCPKSSHSQMRKTEQLKKNLNTHLCRLVAQGCRYTGRRLSSFSYHWDNQPTKQNTPYQQLQQTHRCTTGGLAVSRCCGSTPQPDLPTIHVVFFSQ